MIFMEPWRADMFMEPWRVDDGPLCLDDFDDGDGACLMWWSPDDRDRAILEMP